MLIWLYDLDHFNRSDQKHVALYAPERFKYCVIVGLLYKAQEMSLNLQYDLDTNRTKSSSSSEAC